MAMVILYAAQVTHDLFGNPVFANSLSLSLSGGAVAFFFLSRIFYLFGQSFHLSRPRFRLPADVCLPTKGQTLGFLSF